MLFTYEVIQLPNGSHYRKPSEHVAGAKRVRCMHVLVSIVSPQQRNFAFIVFQQNFTLALYPRFHLELSRIVGQFLARPHQIQGVS